MARASAVLDAWTAPATPAEALAYRPLAEAVTAIPLPLPIGPDEVERHVAVARRNREYSVAHTDAMLPGDPPLLPGLLARAEALDAAERAALGARLAEWQRRRALGTEAVAAADVRLATTLRELILALEPGTAAVLCLRHGLAGDRPRRAEEVARLLGLDAATARALEAGGLAALRTPARASWIRDVLDADVAPSPQPYS
jgi:hypothetical protein